MIGLSDDRNVRTMVRTFRDLDVYQKAYALSLEIHRKSLSFPQHEQFALANQIRRASKGICANIAEGFAKQQSSKPEFKRFLLIALGSAQEMQVWCDYCRDLAYVEETEINAWQAGYETVCRMLQALYTKV